MKRGYWFGEETRPAVLTALLSACYEFPYQQDYVEWVSRRSRWFVACCGQELVGCYGIASVTYKTSDVLLDVGLANNAGLLRQHRGGSLFVDLGLYAMREFGATAYLGVSNDLAINGHLKTKWNHSHDVGFAEGPIPVGGFDTWQPEGWGAYHVRDQEWRVWRYAKPGECYKVSSGVVYKMCDGTCQVVESSEFARATVFGAGVKVGLMTSVDSHVWASLLACGFKERFRRHVVVKGALAACLPPRIEPCEYDVF